MTIFADNINPESFIGLAQNSQEKKGLKRRILTAIDTNNIIVSTCFTVILCIATVTGGTVHKIQKDQLHFIASTVHHLKA